jgi:hypothetical protein
MEYVPNIQAWFATAMPRILATGWVMTNVAVTPAAWLYWSDMDH